MMKIRKKILYITNVSMDGQYLKGVIIKINGQINAFKNNGFILDLLYTGDTNNLFLLHKDNKKEKFKGSRQVQDNNYFAKVFSRLKVAWFGDINFQDCYDTIKKNKYDAIYIRFYMPGTNLISFLNRLKNDNPSTKILLEYPTLNVATEFRKRDLVARITYYLNKKRIGEFNKLSDHIITLTKDKYLFGKQAIFMANGIELAGIKAVGIPAFKDEIIFMGVASDCTFYHGFDKVVKGLYIYAKEKKEIKVSFRLITNPLSKNVNFLKKLVDDLGIKEIVSFELPKSRKELAYEYSQVHIGIGMLAIHRINMIDNYALKHREYAAFGLPFVMSKGDDCFQESPFVFTIERDEKPLEIQKIVDYYLSLRRTCPLFPQEFRNSVEQYITWDVQMKNIFTVINNG